MGLIRSILVVCVGNVCRSPMGEALLRDACPTIQVNSAGLAALVGAPADPLTIEAASQIGLNLTNHIAQQLTRDLATAHDLVLVMEHEHLRTIQKLYPAISGRTLLYDHWVGRNGITDPYRKPFAVHIQIRDELSVAAAAWATRLDA